MYTILLYLQMPSMWNYNLAEAQYSIFSGLGSLKNSLGAEYAASVRTPMQASDYYLHRVGIPHNRIYTCLPTYLRNHRKIYFIKQGQIHQGNNLYGDKAWSKY